MYYRNEYENQRYRHEKPHILLFQLYYQYKKFRSK